MRFGIFLGRCAPVDPTDTENKNCLHEISTVRAWSGIRLVRAEELTWRCQCGREITASLAPDEVVECSACGHRYSFAHLTALSEDQRKEVYALFDALYIDGYGTLETRSASIYVFEDRLLTLFRRVGFEADDIRVTVNFDSIESLSVLQEREVTALRTFLVGPVLAAWLKKKTRILAIGFRDELGLIQTPNFKMVDLDVEQCYNAILDQLKKSK
jgi:DNA-directed RNA polymerase subunit RPC12/RpoP